MLPTPHAYSFAFRARAGPSCDNFKRGISTAQLVKDAKHAYACGYFLLNVKRFYPLESVMRVDKLRLMATTSDEFDRKCHDLVERIKERILKAKPTEAQLATARTNTDALRKRNVRRFVQLGELAQVLKTTPNWLLSFEEGDDREAVKGLMDALVMSLGHLPPEQFQPLVETALKALDSPAIRKSHVPLRDSARILALDSIQRFLNEERQ